MELRFDVQILRIVLKTHCLIVSVCLAFKFYETLHRIGYWIDNMKLDFSN